MPKLCEFYPTEEEAIEYGPFCGCNSDVSGGPPCTEEYSLTCQWANEARERRLKE